MSKVILYIYLASLTVDSYYCWLTDINTKMLSQNMDRFGHKLEDEFHNDVIATKNQFGLIFPGTKWCGPSNIAQHDDDLGTEVEADACCREHDKCADMIGGGATNYDLTNPAFYTRWDCGCDDLFYSCLKASDTSTAKYIGVIYFNILNTQCFRKYYPVTGCIKRGGWFKSKCLEYSYNKTVNRKYQWFDVKDF
ncbi:hypothetical protein PYW08_008067 [Mythimna loreyi]|uniref:Uncharacterized protein n=1 Tax=Mythimna loreyi TaxID=667449 RepID=A0ACC2QBB2_9NEOP|nr:hypothetical protein PYW08_008067 [Mythimna loreyi]